MDYAVLVEIHGQNLALETRHRGSENVREGLSELCRATDNVSLSMIGTSKTGCGRSPIGDLSHGEVLGRRHLRCGEAGLQQCYLASATSKCHISVLTI